MNVQIQALRRLDGSMVHVCAEFQWPFAELYGVHGGPEEEVNFDFYLDGMLWFSARDGESYEILKIVKYMRDVMAGFTRKSFPG